MIKRLIIRYLLIKS